MKKGGEAVVVSKEYVAPIYASEPKTEDAPPVQAEQWWVLVRMRADARRVRVPVEQSEWEKLQPGDSANVRYSQGKYTGKIWTAELK